MSVLLRRSEVQFDSVACLLSSPVEDMSDEELQEKALGVAKHTLSGKTDLERATVLHQHIGSRAMGDMVIETFEPGPGEDMPRRDTKTGSSWYPAQCMIRLESVELLKDNTARTVLFLLSTKPTKVLLDIDYAGILY